MTRQRFRALGLAALMVLSVLSAGGGFAAAQQQPTVTPADASVEVGASTTASVTLDSAPNGLQLYNITITLSDGTVADIQGAQAGDVGGFQVVEQSADSITIRAADLAQSVDPGATDVNLGTIEFSGDTAGSSDIQVSVNRMENDNGNAINPSLQAGTLTVTSTSSPSTPSVTFTDQPSLNGDTVLIDDAAPGGTGETLAVWNLSNGSPDQVLASQPINSPVQNVNLDLDPDIESSQTLVATVHSASPPNLAPSNIVADDSAIVTPVEADASESDSSVVRTFFQGQAVVLEGDFTQGEDYQIRDVRDTRGDREVGSLEREVRSVRDGQLIIRTDRVDPGTFVVEDDNTNLAPGDSLPADLATYNGFAFEVAVQELGVTADQDEYTSGDTVELELDSNRAGYDVVVSTSNTNITDGNNISRTFTNLGDFEVVEVTAPPVNESTDVDFNVEVTDTTAEASDTATVNPEDEVIYQNVGADFEANTLGDAEGQETGDIVEVTIDYNADYSDYDDDDKFQSYVTLGGAGSNFVDLVRVRDEDRDGVTTFTINTYRLGTTPATETATNGLFAQDDTSLTYNVAGQSEADAPDDDDPADGLLGLRVDEEYIDTTAFDLESELSRPVDSDSYTVRTHNFSELEPGERPIGTQQQSEGTAVVTRLSYPVVDDTSSLSLADRQLGSLRTWIAPQSADVDDVSEVSDAIEAGSLTPAQRVAQDDTLVVQLNATGLGGQIAAVEDETGDARDAFTGYDGLFLVMEQQNPRANTDTFYLDVDGPGVELITDQANDTYYLTIDTSRVQDARTGADLSTNARLSTGSYSVDAIFAGGSDDGGTFADYFEEGDFPDSDSAAFDAIFPGFGQGSVAPFDPYKAQNEQELLATDPSVVERRATFDRVDPDGNLRVVAYDDGSAVTGTTTLAPGSTFTIQLQNESGTDRGFIVRSETTATADQTWSITTDLSDVPIEPATNFRATIQDGGDVIVGSTQADLEGNVPGLALGASTVSIADQESLGERVLTESVFLPQGGFIAIHATTENGTVGPVIGSSQYLPPGTHENIGVQLDVTLEESQTVIAMPHQDTNENQIYEFPEADAPYTELDGETIVIDSANIEIPSDDTPTPTDTPEPEDPTPTPTPTDTPEPEDPTPTPTEEPTPTDTETSGQPGFGLAVSLIALIGAALIALRRRD